MRDLEIEHERKLQEALQHMRLDHEETFRKRIFDHEKEMEQMRIAHAEELTKLNEAKDAIQQQLSNIESM